MVCISGNAVGGPGWGEGKGAIPVDLFKKVTRRGPSHEVAYISCFLAPSPITDQSGHVADPILHCVQWDFAGPK